MPQSWQKVGEYEGLLRLGVCSMGDTSEYHSSKVGTIAEEPPIVNGIF